MIQLEERSNGNATTVSTPVKAVPKSRKKKEEEVTPRGKKRKVQDLPEEDYDEVKMEQHGWFKEEDGLDYEDS